MYKYLIVSLLAFGLAGCANTTNIAGKSLLATQQTIIATHEAFREPCAKGIVPVEDCNKIDKLTNGAKEPYDAAVAAEVLVLQGGSDSTDATAKKAAFGQFAVDMLTLATKYGLVGGTSK